MITSYFKFAKRNLVSNKTYSFLNIVGLSVGLTCFAFIALWVNDELSYDKFNSNYDRIFRLVSTAKTESAVNESATSSAPMAKALKDDYPEVENTVRVRMREEIITHNNQQTLQPGILLADPSLFEVFSYHMTRGDAASALANPYSIILTESTAKKYFGDSDPIGQTLVLNMLDSNGKGASYKITGIMPDPPKNAHFRFEMIASFRTVEIARPNVLTVDGWGDGSFYTYVLLKKGIDHKAFSKKITQFYGKYIGELYSIWRNIYFYRLQPLSEIHLRSNLQNEISRPGSMTQVYIFSTIGIFILLLAGINYTNLATARSSARAKEVGIKKVAGALKRQLMMQYFFESVLMAVMAFLLSLLFAFLLELPFQELTGKEISLFSSALLLFFLLAVTILLGVLSGIYPAMILSSFKPAGVLKGAFKFSDKGIVLRRTLVISQFVITIILITGIIVIFSQMSFIKHKDLGYNKDELLFLRIHGNADVITGYEAFRNELQANPLISDITRSNSMIAGGLGTGGSETVDLNGRPQQVNTARLRVDTNYFSTYGIKLLAGRNFSSNSARDSIRPIILNEVAVKKFGWKVPADAIGKPFKMGNRPGAVIGVVSNFHFNSLQESIEPLAIYPVDGNVSRITIKIDVKKADQVISFLGKTWKKHFPGALFDYDFLNQQISEQYESEERFSTIFLYFSILSLLIACLGLYGLISYSIFQRTKEIGIRKVLGATGNGIAAMLSGGFLKLVLIAGLISIPVAWYVMKNWLQGFAYRVEISWWMFGLSLLMVLVVAFASISFQAIKAAIANPVKSLRTE